MSDGKNEQTELLREILKWIRFMGSSEVKTTLVSALDTEKKKLAYQMSDGRNARRIIGEQVGIDDRAVSEWWQQWILLGIGEGIAVAGGGNRFKRSFDLKALGINLPTVKSKKVEVATPVQLEPQQPQGGDDVAHQ